jgi:hypothetical protein
MLATTETLLDRGLGNCVFTEQSFDAIFQGSPAKRYALIHKALKKGELLRLHRGVYMLAPKYRSEQINVLCVANRMVPGSFVSFETALAWHGWIPERVNLMMSVIAKGRTKSFHTPLGDFDYVKVPVRHEDSLQGVTWHDAFNDQTFLMASPLRALADYVYLRKRVWTDLGFLLEGMRIDEDHLMSLKKEDFEAIMRVYHSSRVVSFFENLRKSLEK